MQQLPKERYGSLHLLTFHLTPQLKRLPAASSSVLAASSGHVVALPGPQSHCPSCPAMRSAGRMRADEGRPSLNRSTTRLPQRRCLVHCSVVCGVGSIPVQSWEESEERQHSTIANRHRAAANDHFPTACAARPRIHAPTPTVMDSTHPHTHTRVPQKPHKYPRTQRAGSTQLERNVKPPFVDSCPDRRERTGWLHRRWITASVRTTGGMLRNLGQESL
jgi:hypothetical protein